MQAEPEKLMAYWNWIYGDEGLTIMNYGEEGVHYEAQGWQARIPGALL